MLNPDLDAEKLAAEYQRDERLLIRDILAPDVAERVHEYCGQAVPYDVVYHLDGRNHARSEQEMAALSRDELAALQRELHTAAARGVGFLYGGYMIRRAHRDTDDERLRYLHGVFDFLNGPEMLGFIGRVTGRDDLRSADAQFTRFVPGQFLTRHRDDVTVERRRVAYVLGLTRRWHPDWGGMLQFFNDDGTPRDAWPPLFNVLSLFDVRHVHSVTYVAPYAQAPRLSLTGWFRAGSLE